ncbi:Ppx/GppA phosphatase family protein [Ornithinimicrobium cerasi]|uniref:Exopolyphosphatase / guanosine-5'-triphosphate,3'-diphosphate pyrophosphatase n=1 Tax=Ornithinimicrobium cerasi TaxID=2248773 RepID=A0A285VQK6_9MICO|nr:Ppx/GppA phosphatase family protein [Ornithinimicrobium cerasi]SOC56354.1 exopolyphosphatase / guanosine-5'-triphosphate,3'-diphosphate pyrophosphatase [Ornithinimicrobium cerasi]
MRLGVIDVGSNTVHLLVVDAYHPGAHPMPDYSHSTVLRLAEQLTPAGDISPRGADRLSRVITSCVEVAEERGVSQLMGFATSAIREAGNTEEVLGQVKEASGVDLEVLDGDDEARVTFLAARRWFGWSAGRLLLMDVGGGSLELAAGLDELPDVAVSLPLGAGRLTRELDGDPPGSRGVKELRKRVRAEIATVQPRLARGGERDLAVGTSKTIRSLARACGAAPRAEGPYVRRTLTHADLSALVQRLATMPAAERAALPGVSAGRAPQLLAGAVVVEAAMDLFGVGSLAVCPWALREGLILRFLDAMTGRHQP